jgi:hypothetical protein
MEKEFNVGNARWVGEIPDTPSNLTRAVLNHVGQGIGLAWNLVQALGALCIKNDEEREIVAELQALEERLDALLARLPEADRAWHERKRLTTEQAEQERAAKQREADLALLARSVTHNSHQR